MKNYKQNPVKETPKPSMETKDLAVSKYMATKLIIFTPDVNIYQAIDTLLRHSISGAPVLNEKKEVVGMIDDKDSLKVLIDRLYHNQPVHKASVSDYMDSVYKKISIDTDILEVANIFLTTTFKRLLVVDHKGNLAGQVSRSDILEAIHHLQSK